MLREVSQGLMQSYVLLEQCPVFNVPVDSDATPLLEIVINLPKGHQTPKPSTWTVEGNQPDVHPQKILA